MPRTDREPWWFFRTCSTKMLSMQQPRPSILIEHGISLPTIQGILGHGSLKTTEVYMHVTLSGTERLQEVLDKLMLDL